MDQKVTITDMRCAACAAKIETELMKVDGVTSVRCDVPGKVALISGEANRASLLTAIEKAGFKPQR